MNQEEILRHVDHTLLAVTAAWDEIEALCCDAIRFRTASVCIPPRYVRRAAAYCAGRMPVCTVVGFPNGYATAAAKCFEAREAIADGAEEIDTVIPLGLVKAGDFSGILEELKALRGACAGKILKVIVETCLLTETEKIKLCETVAASGADFIKTSTGFSTGGATLADVALMRAHVPSNVQVKAAGGIRGFADAQAMLDAGASRLGTSALVKLAKEARFA